MSTAAARAAGFPGTLYDGDGTRLVGDGPEFTSGLADDLPHKALIRDRPGSEEVAVLETGDRLWVLPDTLGDPPELPIPLLAELAEVVRRGRSVGLAARDPETPRAGRAGAAAGRQRRPGVMG